MSIPIALVGAAVLTLATVSYGQLGGIPRPPLPPPQSPQQQPGEGERFGGIGIAYDRLPDGMIRVGGVLPGGPADQAGIAAGDLIVIADNVPTQKLTDDAIPTVMRGPVGSRITLVVVRQGQPPREVTLTRAAVTRPAPGNNNNPPPRDAGNVPRQSGVQKFRLMTILDPKAGNVPAVAAMVPEGWKFEGGPVWVPDTANAVYLQLRIADPQTGRQVEWLPTRQFCFSPQPPVPMQIGVNYMGRTWLPPEGDADRLARQMYPHLQQARLIGKELLQGPTQYLRQQMGNRTPGQAQVVRLRYEFSAGQQAWEQDLFLALAYQDMGMGMTYWEVNSAVALSAPKGQLDPSLPLLKAVYNSTQTTPLWIATVRVCQDLFRQGMIQMQNDTVAFGRKLQEYNAHIQQQSQQLYQERMASADARNESFRETLAGVENRRDAYNRENVYLPAGYKEYWSNDKGEYVMADQTGFDPNSATDQSWRKMDRIDPMAGRGGW